MSNNLNMENTKEKMRLDFTMSPSRRNNYAQIMANSMAQQTAAALSTLGPHVSTPILNKMLPMTPNKELVELSPNLIASNLPCAILPSSMIPTTVDNMNDSDSGGESPSSYRDSDSEYNSNINIEDNELDHQQQQQHHHQSSSGHRTQSVIQINRSKLHKAQTPGIDLKQTNNLNDDNQLRSTYNEHRNQPRDDAKSSSSFTCNNNNSNSILINDNGSSNSNKSNNNNSRRVQLDEDKIAKKRARNRLAAKKCRQKKTETIENLRKTVSRLEQTILRLEQNCYHYQIELENSREVTEQLRQDNRRLLEHIES